MTENDIDPRDPEEIKIEAISVLHEAIDGGLSEVLNVPRGADKVDGELIIETYEPNGTKAARWRLQIDLTRLD